MKGGAGKRDDGQGNQLVWALGFVIQSNKSAWDVV